MHADAERFDKTLACRRARLGVDRPLWCRKWNGQDCERQPSLHLQFLLLFTGWANRHQHAVSEDLQTENQSLREHLCNKRIRWTDAQRERLAEKAKAIGTLALAALGRLVTPDTLLRWYRNPREAPFARRANP